MSRQKLFKEQLIGSWKIVLNNNIGADGEKRQIFGRSPKGLFILGADGRYALVVVNPDRPKFQGKSRLEGTPEENKAAVTGTVASFGTWTPEVDGTTGTGLRDIVRSIAGRGTRQRHDSRNILTTSSP